MRIEENMKENGERGRIKVKQINAKGVRIKAKKGACGVNIGVLRGRRDFGGVMWLYLQVCR